MPITVIIGRNNTGKSRLLDFARELTAPTLSNVKYLTRCEATFDEEFLGAIFRKDSAGGELGPQVLTFTEQMSHWNVAGQHFRDQTIQWQSNSNGAISHVTMQKPPQLKHNYYAAAQRAIEARLDSLTCPMSGRQFRRLLADRDIQPESSIFELTLGYDGAGATNIIRKYITSSSLPEGLIQDELLSSLNAIFGSDGKFDRIEIREHDEHDKKSENGSSLWEVFLGERDKGQIALSNSGSGLKTVLLVLLNLLVVPEIDRKNKVDYVFAFEELENNLHPALLRRLFDYLSDYVTREHCRVLLTTHSNVAVDYFGLRSNSQIIHVWHDGKSAHTKTVKTHFDQVGLVSELGARPSDLLQANGVVWVEGPSDRIYVNKFIELYSEGELREGRDYQCAYYGGALLAKSQFTPPQESSDEYANLLRLNNNVAVICDGDRTAGSGDGSKIKARVQRIMSEVGQLPQAFVWVTEAKEIENYIPGDVWGKVYNLSECRDPRIEDRFPTGPDNDECFVFRELKRRSFDKCEFASDAVDFLTRENLRGRFDLDQRLRALVEVIRKWNR